MKNLLKKTDSILFDLDGTLWDSVTAIATAWNLGAKKVDPTIALTEKDVRGVMGLTATGIKEKLLPNNTEEEQNQIFKECEKVEQQYLKENGGILYPKVEETLAILSKKMPLFIVSNCGEGYIQGFLDFFNFHSYFQDFEYYARTGREKGENIKTVIKRNHLINPIYVGDTAGDFTAAKKAGVPFIYASYGFGTVEAPDFTINSIEELTPLF